MRRRGLEPPPGYPGPGPQPGNTALISVRFAPDRPNRPEARTIWTHWTIWMLSRMLLRAANSRPPSRRWRRLGRAGWSVAPLGHEVDARRHAVEPPGHPRDPCAEELHDGGHEDHADVVASMRIAEASPTPRSLRSTSGLRTNVPACRVERREARRHDRNEAGPGPGCSTAYGLRFTRGGRGARCGAGRRLPLAAGCLRRRQSTSVMSGGSCVSTWFMSPATSPRRARGGCRCPATPRTRTDGGRRRAPVRRHGPRS